MAAAAAWALMPSALMISSRSISTRFASHFTFATTSDNQRLLVRKAFFRQAFVQIEKESSCPMISERQAVDQPFAIVRILFRKIPAVPIQIFIGASSLWCFLRPRASSSSVDNPF